MIMKSSALILLVTLLGVSGAPGEENVIGYEEKEIIDILNQTLSGQCLVPTICLDKGQSCGIDSNHHVIVNCTYRQAGPYVPSFQPYILPRRTWDIDFSHNYITDLDSSSFMAPYGTTVNLTRIDISDNFVKYIAPNTFRGEISKVLRYIDLSSNSLMGLEAGTFSDVPALQTLILSNNKLLNMDTLCATPFPALTSLDVEFNMVSRLPLSCLATSTKTVALNLNNNKLGSLDDCSFSDKVTAEVNGNPTLCGCSSKFFSKSCLKIESATNRSMPSSEPRCTDSNACLNVTFTASYEWVDAKSGLYTATIHLSDMTHYVEVVQYTKPADDVYTATLVQSESGVMGKFTSATVNTSTEFSVCVTPGSDMEGRQRSCHLLVPPTYYESAASHVTSALGLMLLASVMAMLH